MIEIDTKWMDNKELEKLRGLNFWTPSGDNSYIDRRYMDDIFKNRESNGSDVKGDGRTQTFQPKAELPFVVSGRKAEQKNKGLSKHSFVRLNHMDEVFNDSSQSLKKTSLPTYSLVKYYKNQNLFSLPKHSMADHDTSFSGESTKSSIDLAE